MIEDVQETVQATARYDQDEIIALLRGFAAAVFVEETKKTHKYKTTEPHIERAIDNVHLWESTPSQDRFY